MPNNSLSFVQDFIEQHHPHYPHIEAITNESDLHQIVHMPDEVEDGSCQASLRDSYSQEEHDNNIPKLDWMQARIEVLEASIQEFMSKSEKTSQPSDYSYYLFGNELVSFYDNGIASVILNFKDELSEGYNLFKIRKDSGHEAVLEAYDGWTDYACITKEEYDITASPERYKPELLGRIALIDYLHRNFYKAN